MSNQDSPDDLRALGQTLPWDKPDAARRELVRAQLLLAAADAPPVRRRLGLPVAFVAGALAAAAVILLVVRTGEAPTPHAQVIASPSAQLEHTVASTPAGRDETVRVHAGAVRIVAPALTAAERVRVATGDATIDGVGDYEVVAAADRLATVTVRTGSARVVVDGQARFLAAGESWHAPVVAAELVGPDARRVEVAPAVPSPAPSETRTPAPPAPAPSETRTPGPPALAPSETRTPAPPAPAPSEPRTPGPPAPPPALPDPGSLAMSESRTPPPPAAPLASRTNPALEQHLQAGWALLRAGKPREAAVELGRAARGNDPLAVDARYFQAVALVQAGATAEAEQALVDFLDRAPRSLRRGRATVMLARLGAQRGDIISARAWFAAALQDADPEVVAAARAGIAALPP